MCRLVPYNESPDGNTEDIKCVGACYDHDPDDQFIIDCYETPEYCTHSDCTSTITDGPCDEP